MPLRALLVGIDESTAQAIVQSLDAAGYDLRTERVPSCFRLARAFRSGRWDLAFATLGAQQRDAMRTLNAIRRLGQALPVIIVGAAEEADEAIAAMRAGARDFVRTDSMDWVVPIVERELRNTQELAAHRSDLVARDAEIRDLTDTLRHRQKLHLLGSLAGSIAHDFNNMLSVVMSYSRAALEESTLSPGLREDLVEIVKASESAAELSNRLLGFSRPQRCGPASADVNTVIGEMEKMFRHVLGEQVELVLSLAPRLSSVRVGHGELEQVLMNLVVNARDAMPNGGRLRIATREAEAGSLAGHRLAGADGVVLVVSDTGVGMDSATRARVFEPFFTTKAAGKGTGLGLSTVLEIVRENGGALQLESEPGQGTTFWIQFLAETKETPLDETVSAGHAARRPTEPSGRVLLIEDDAPVRRSLERVLTRNGYSVTGSSTAEEALAIAELHQQKFDLLICDVALPGVSGPALAKELARRKEQLPVLYISGYSDETLAQKGLAQEMTCILRKPITPEGLIRKVRETLDGARTLNRGGGQGSQP